MDTYINHWPFSHPDYITSWLRRNGRPPESHDTSFASIFVTLDISRKLKTYLDIPSLTPSLNARADMQKSSYATAIHHLTPPISSAPFLTTPTTAPVCTTSPPPPLNLYSTSAKPSNHVIITGAGISNFVNSSPSAVMISASANPCVTFKEFIVCRQDVTSGVLRRVLRILVMSSGCGDAMHS